MVRYRTAVDEEKRIAIGIVGYGTHASGSDRGESYSANRMGAEAGADLRMTDRSSWAELHMYAGASGTGIFADGRYCEDATTGYAVDCPENQTGDVKADLAGVFPAAFAGASFDFARHLDSAFHGLRLATFAAGGLMPTYQNAKREENKTYTAVGVALTVGLGATSPKRRLSLTHPGSFRTRSDLVPLPHPHPRGMECCGLRRYVTAAQRFRCSHAQREAHENARRHEATSAWKRTPKS